MQHLTLKIRNGIHSECKHTNYKITIFWNVIQFNLVAREYCFWRTYSIRADASQVNCQL